MLFPCNLKDLFRGSERSMIRRSRLWRPCCLLLSVRLFPHLFRLLSNSGMSRVFILELVPMWGLSTWKIHTPAADPIGSFTNSPWALFETRRSISSHISELIRNYARSQIVACGTLEIADQCTFLYRKVFYVMEGLFFWPVSQGQSGLGLFSRNVADGKLCFIHATDKMCFYFWSPMQCWYLRLCSSCSAEEKEQCEQVTYLHCAKPQKKYRNSEKYF